MKLMILVAWIMTFASLHGESSDPCPERCPGNDVRCKSKPYHFAFMEQPGLIHVDEDGFRGPPIDLVKKVCSLIGRKCVPQLVDYADCWKEKEDVSGVLGNGRSEACIMLKSDRRQQCYKFSKLPIAILPKVMGIVKKDSKLEEKDFRNKNYYTLAYMANPDLESSIMLNEFLHQYNIKNVIAVNTGNTRKDVNEIITKVVAGDADLGLILPSDGRQILHSDIKRILEFGIGLHTITFMTRKTEDDLFCWWDVAYRRFFCSENYPKFCKEMDAKYGEHELNCVPEVERNVICAASK